jgi:ubiquinone/menaquinone biosynthesis C-methylase UbiE
VAALAHRGDEAGRVFDRQAARYDAWYETERGAAIFAEELRALRPLTTELPRPWLEIGVGTGRFAAALGIEVGVDPARGALELARQRHVAVVAARGEALPFRTGAFGAAFILVTLCFVADSLAVLREAARVVRPGGGIVLGLVPAESPWGERYRMLAAQGDQFYRDARFLGRSEVSALLDAAGLRAIRWRSALVWPPQSDPPVAPVVLEGVDPRAGFIAVLAVHAESSGRDRL